MRTSNLPILIAVILAVFSFDAASKFWIYQYFPEMGFRFLTYPYGGIGIFENIFGIEFSIVHATNKGAAWGAFSDFQVPLLLLRIALIAALLVYLFAFNKRKSMGLALALVIGGAAGNVIDYFFYGHVIDMFYFVFWGLEYPVFNAADSFIFLGIAMIFFETYRDTRVLDSASRSRDT